MWLLTTSRAELKYFPSPKDVPEPGFAILSHTWGENEQTFQDLQRIHRECKESGDNPRDWVSDKIRRCCELAEADGYGWAWADMCCIDKTSSAELTEAINSMFRYYQLSGVCYVYLEDVHSFPLLETPSPTMLDQLKECRWRTRGWTLQELIAPTFAVFLSSSWMPLGSKEDLAKELSIATKIPEALLRLDRNLDDFSIAQRMSWAAERVTTREEDEAYCLLGIFSIHMPTLYGEGRNAFQRLQEEIMRTSPDTTLFAWGSIYWPLQPPEVSATETASPIPEDGRLLAIAPRDFLNSGKVVYNHHSSPHSNHTSLTMTPHGVRARALVANVGDPGAAVVMNLFWTEEASSKPLFLVLSHVTDLHNQTSESSTLEHSTLDPTDNNQYSVYIIYPAFLSPPPETPIRLFAFDPLVEDFRWRMADIHFPKLAHRGRSADDTVGNPSRGNAHNRRLAVAFHFHMPLRQPWYDFVHVLAMRRSDARDDVFMIVVRVGTERDSTIDAYIGLGVCKQGELARAPHQEAYSATPRSNTVHWARAYLERPDSGTLDYHICSEDHISDWPNHTKIVIPQFRLLWKDRGVVWHEHGSLSVRFIRSPYNPDIMVLRDILLTGMI